MLGVIISRDPYWRHALWSRVSPLRVALCIDQIALVIQSQAGIKVWLMLSGALDIKPTKLFLQIIIRILSWHLHARKLMPLIGKTRNAVSSQAVHFCQFAECCTAQVVCDIVV